MEFFSVELRILEVTEVEKYVLLKIIPNLEGLPKARIMVDKKFNIINNNAQVVNVLGINETTSLKKAAGDNLFGVVPEVSKILEEYTENLHDLLKAKPIKFFSRVQLCYKYKSNCAITKKTEFYLKVMRLDDSGFFLITIWRPYYPQLGDQDQHNLSKILGQSKEKEKQKLEKKIDNFEFSITKSLKFLGKFEMINPPKMLSIPPKIGFGKNSRMSKNHTKPEQNSKQEEVINFLRNSVRNKAMRSNSQLKIDYGEGIRTKRLQDGMIRDIYENEEDGSSDSGFFHKNAKNHRKSIFRKNDKKKERAKKRIKKMVQKNNKKSDRLASRKQLDDKIIGKRDSLQSIELFKSSVLVYGTLCFVLSVWFTLEDRVMLRGIDSLENLERSLASSAISLQEAEFRIRQLSLLNSGINLLRNTPRSSKIGQLKLEAFEYLSLLGNKINELHTQLESFIPPSSEFELLKQERSLPVVEIITRDKRINYTYSNAIYKICSLMQSMAGEKNVSLVNFENSDVGFVLENLRKSIHKHITRVLGTCAKIRENISESSKQKVQERSNLLLVIGLILVIIGYFSIYCSYSSKEEVVETFYDFRDDYMRSIIKNSADFIEFINSEESTIISDQVGQIGANRAALEAPGVAEVDPNTEEGRKIDQNESLGSFASIGGTLHHTSDYINLKKRKKKGSLIRVCSFWQLAFLSFFGLSYFGCLYRFIQQDRIINIGTDAARFIEELSSLDCAPLRTSNLLMIEMTDFRKTDVLDQIDASERKLYSESRYIFEVKFTFRRN